MHVALIIILPKHITSGHSFHDKILGAWLEAFHINHNSFEAIKEGKFVESVSNISTICKPCCQMDDFPNVDSLEGTNEYLVNEWF